jgi:hypothetical protein
MNLYTLCYPPAHFLWWRTILDGVYGLCSVPPKEHPCVNSKGGWVKLAKDLIKEKLCDLVALLMQPSAIAEKGLAIPRSKRPSERLSVKINHTYVWGELTRHPCSQEERILMTRVRRLIAACAPKADAEHPLRSHTLQAFVERSSHMCANNLDKDDH